RNRMPPGRAHDDVRVAPGPAGTAPSLGNERQREPVFLDRGPERVRPHARLGGLAHLPRDALGEEARHHVGEDRAQLVHCIESRGAGAFGGWPETRCVPAAFCMLLPIPSARGAGAFGGWPETRCVPAAFCMLLPIPPARGAGAFGGWPETRCVPAAFCMLLPIPSARGAGAFGGWPAKGSRGFNCIGAREAGSDRGWPA